MVLKWLSNNPGWRCVIGGFTVHLVLGTLYCWGIITTAVTAHLRRYSPDLTYNQTLAVYASALACQGATMFLGGVMEQRIGARYTCMIGGYILVLGTFLSSTATSLLSIIIYDGVMFGIGVGLCYTAPIACATRWMPKKKGVIAGIIVGGFGGGAFGFGLLSTAILNWNGPSHGEVKVDNYLSSESHSAGRVSTMFLILGVCYFVLISLGCWLLIEAPNHSLTHNSLASVEEEISLENHHTIHFSDDGDEESSAGDGGRCGGGGSGKNKSLATTMSMGGIDCRVNPLHRPQSCDNLSEKSLEYSPFNTPSSASCTSFISSPSSLSPSLPSSSSKSSPVHPMSSLRSYQTIPTDYNEDSTLDMEMMMLASVPPTSSASTSASASTFAAVSPVSSQRGSSSESKECDGKTKTVSGASTGVVLREGRHRRGGHMNDTRSEIGEEVDVSGGRDGGVGEDKSALGILLDPLAWHVASCFSTTALGGMFVAGTFKTYGQLLFTSAGDDAFLSSLGSSAAVFNAGGRVVWGMLADSMGPIHTLMGLALVFSLLLLSYPTAASVFGRGGFAVWTFAIFLFEGGNFALYMPVTVQLFGLTNAASNYGLIFTSYSIANVSVMMGLAHLNADFEASSFIMGIITAVGFFNLLLLKQHVRRRFPHILSGNV